MESFELYGVKFKRLSEEMALGLMAEALKGKSPLRVFTPNLEMLSAAAVCPSVRELLLEADLLLPDGIGITLLCRRNGITPPPRLTGIDTALELLKYAAENGNSVYLLGGKPSVALRAAEGLRSQLPNLLLCGTHHGYFDPSSDSYENDMVLRDINSHSPRILLVCMGFPRQEEWIVKNAHKLPSVRIFMGLGGSLDVWSGDVRRAPRWIQKMRLEWLWRCILQPSRIPRLLGSAFRIVFS